MNPKCTMMPHIGIMNNMRPDLTTSKTPFTKKESIEKHSLPNHWDGIKFAMEEKIKPRKVNFFFI